MRATILVILLAALFAFTAKSQDTSSTTNRSDVTSAATCSLRQARPDSIIPSSVLDPTSINITLADLPKPYATKSASKSARVVEIPNNASLQVPANFTVNVFARSLTGPRWLALTPDGHILVTETSLNRISILIDEDDDGTADVVDTFANADNGVNHTFGMLFANGYFYIANEDEIRRYNYTNGSRSINGTGERITRLSAGGEHWTRNLLLSADGQQIYVSVGSRENVGVDPITRASIWIMNLDGKNQSVFASGLRNPIGMGFDPVTKDLYTVVNERDGLGDNLVPDYLTRVQKGQFFGWPYTYLSPDNLDPREVTKNGASLNPRLAAKTVTPDVLFEAHSAALSLAFSTGNTFPSNYRNGAFVTFHGSWNRNQGTGYKVVWVPFGGDNRPLGDYEDFVTGFLINPSGPTTWGRPTGIIVAADGSLVFTDEGNGRVYRVQYQC